MKIKLILLLILTIVIAGCTNNENSSEDLVEKNNEITENDGESNEHESAVKKTIDLTFTPVPKLTLKEGFPEEQWIKGKSIYFGDLPNQIESTVHLYIDNNSNSPDLKSDEGTIYGFIEHKNKLYEIGVVGYYGIDNVNIKLADRTFDGIKEIEIVGGMGATYIEMKIIAYNEINKNWESLLTMGSPEIVDLDMDGKEELAAISTGSLPPFVDVYRWNNNHFERVDIAEAAESSYARLYTADGEWFMEAGTYENGETSKFSLYKYKDGKLIEQ